MFEELYDICQTKILPRKVNKRVKTSDTVCALKAINNKIYYGISLVGSCGVGFCSEQSAISEMIKDDVTVIKEILIIDKFGNFLPPCGRCLELITQINEKNRNTLVYLGEEKHELIKNLMPIDWKIIKDNSLFVIRNKENDPYNLERFIKAQNGQYFDALKELRDEKKKTHWIWFVFPQLKALGNSDRSIYYGISSLEEIKAYIANDLLRERYVKACNILKNMKETNIINVFGEVDAKKLRSSLTLFYLASKNELMLEVLKKYYHGNFDSKTSNILHSWNKEL